MFRSVAEMFGNSPYINYIHFIDFLNQSKLSSFKEILKLRKNNFDVSVNIYPTNRAEYNILGFLTGAKKRIAFSYIKSGFHRFEFLNTNLIPEIRNKHNVLQNIGAIRELVEVNDNEVGKLEISLDKTALAKTRDWLNSLKVSDKLIVGIHPGSSTLKNHIHKRWDKEKFIELCNKLINVHNGFIFIFGNEFELNREIKSSLGENAILVSTENYMDSLLRQTFCDLFVSNDTAFMHSAAAFEIPTVAIFAYTNSRELYPWKTNHRIVREDLDCSPCFYNSPSPASCIWQGNDKWKCIKNITVEKVFEACDELIQEIPHDSKSGN